MSSAQDVDADTRSLDERTLCDDDDQDRPSLEASEGDHDILESEDERERLLTRQEGLGALFSNPGVKIGAREPKRHSPRKRGLRKKNGREETSALMYEMEEGVGGSNSSISRHSSDSDEQRLLKTTTTKRKVG